MFKNLIFGAFCVLSFSIQNVAAQARTTLTINPSNELNVNTTRMPSAVLTVGAAIQGIFVTTFRLQRRFVPSFSASLCPRAARLTGTANATCPLGAACNAATCSFNIQRTWAAGADYFIVALYEDCATARATNCPATEVEGPTVSINVVNPNPNPNPSPNPNPNPNPNPSPSPTQQNNSGATKTPEEIRREESNSANPKLILGIIGGVLGLILIVAILAWYCRRNRANKRLSLDAGSIFFRRLTTKKHNNNNNMNNDKMCENNSYARYGKNVGNTNNNTDSTSATMAAAVASTAAATTALSPNTAYEMNTLMTQQPQPGPTDSSLIYNTPLNQAQSLPPVSQTPVPVTMGIAEAPVAVYAVDPQMASGTAAMYPYHDPMYTTTGYPTQQPPHPGYPVYHVYQ